MTRQTPSRRQFLATTGAALSVGVAGCLATLDAGPATPAAGALDGVVSPGWVDDADDVTRLDVRPTFVYEEGHLPDAAQFPPDALLREHYTEQDAGYDVDTDPIHSALGDAGLAPDDPVVIYGERVTAWPAYALFTLRSAGHQGPCYLLDGGLAAWIEDERPVETGPPQSEDATHDGTFTDAAIATRDDVLAAIEDDETVLLDLRSPPEYHGEETDERVDRHGHIPGAVNLHYRQLTSDEYGRFRDPAQIEDQLWEADIDRDTPVITYCMSGRRAAPGWFILDELGYDVSSYEGSWLDWAAQPEDAYPVATDDGTVIDIPAEP